MYTFKTEGNKDTSGSIQDMFTLVPMVSLFRGFTAHTRACGGHANLYIYTCMHMHIHIEYMKLHVHVQCLIPIIQILQDTDWGYS